MSERATDEGGGGAGAFLFGLAVGAVLGLLLAPGSGGETRARLGRRLRTLRDLAGDKAGELKALVAGTDDDVAEDAEDEDGSARQELERRLAAARARRRARTATREDEPAA